MYKLLFFFVAVSLYTRGSFLTRKRRVSQVLVQALQTIGLSSQESEYLMQNMKETCADWLLLQVLQSLPEDSVERLDLAVLTNTSPGEITELLRREIPQIDSLLMEKLRIFQEDLAASLTAIPRQYPQGNPVQQEQQKSEVIPPSPKDEGVNGKSSPHLIEKRHLELGKMIRDSTRKGDWATAAKLMQEQKKLQEHRKN